MATVDFVSSLSSMGVRDALDLIFAGLSMREIEAAKRVSRSWMGVVSDLQRVAKPGTSLFKSHARQMWLWEPLQLVTWHWHLIASFTSIVLL